MQLNFITKHTARVKPSQYKEQYLYKQTTRVIAAFAAVAAVIRLTIATPKARKSLVQMVGSQQFVVKK